ncbi:hypothetical protein JJQ72_02245 [Paenibacillus sp. F411]|uniref:hypothetical protein n=1 Tax=Paenibacillus sp. F411 TaxID=2820239 RepID=UPI001AAFC104|nr:hypothetical protein [Paenibacillus sp. F411]MBO2942805.1 hypothetical protein [Paenibacillus sp. F411]
MDLKLTGVVKYEGNWKQPGTIIRKVDDKIGQAILDADVADEIEEQAEESETELQTLRDRAKELGVPNAGRLGEAKLKEGIAEKEAELKTLQEKAFELGIEDAYEKDAETLAKEIEAAEGK